MLATIVRITPGINSFRSGCLHQNKQGNDNRHFHALKANCGFRFPSLIDRLCSKIKSLTLLRTLLKCSV